MTNLRLRKTALLAIFTVHATACEPKVPPVARGALVATEQKPTMPRAGTSLALTIVGFNYTNNEIDTFTVNGSGGGNLAVDSGNGGGGSLCCVDHVMGEHPSDIEVRWQADACTYNSRMDEGEEFYDIHRIYKSEVVRVNPVVPKSPHYLEIHFFSDGRVEAAITDKLSKARMKVDPSRVVNGPLRKCPNDQKPS